MRSKGLLFGAILVVSLVGTSAFAEEDVSSFDDMFYFADSNGVVDFSSVYPLNSAEEVKYYLDYAQLKNGMTSSGTVDVTSCNKDITSCTFRATKYNFGKETHEDRQLTIKYADGDSAVNGIVDKLSKKAFSKGILIEDLEVVDYFKNAFEEDWSNDGFSYASTESVMKALYFSEEFKEATDGGNVVLDFAPYGWGDEPFRAEIGGVFTLSYDGVVYDVVSTIELGGNIVVMNNLYIHDSIANDKNAYIEAAQNRLDSIYGRDVFKISEGGEFLGEEYYYLEFSGKKIQIKIIADSSKMKKGTKIKTRDLRTDISINTEYTTLPSDAMISVSSITGGELDEELSKIADFSDNHETFDIDLVSISNGVAIHKMEDGKFFVEIPVPDKLSGRKLSAIYVDDSDNVIKYNVVVNNGVAGFYTDHFSIYTLSDEGAEEIVSNPATNDNIIFMIVVGFVGLLLSALCSCGAVRARRG